MSKLSQIKVPNQQNYFHTFPGYIVWTSLLLTSREFQNPGHLVLGETYKKIVNTKNWKAESITITIGLELF